MNSELAAILDPLPGKTVQAGGLKLFATERGAGRALVFFHGLGWTHGLWRRQLERYGDRYRVIAGDNRGHGQSDKPLDAYTIDDMAADWRHALDAMGVREWCLVGFSQGGMIAQALATLEPARTKALAILGSPCRSNPAARTLMEQRLDAGRKNTRTAAELAAGSILSPAFAAKEPEFIARFIERRAAVDFEPLAAATRALFDFDFSVRIAKLTCPAVVAVGSEDRLCPTSAAEEVARLIPGAGFQLFPGSGHMMMVEEPQAFDRLLDDFLAKHYPPAA
jgi:3-oxoadipate enol-lactonase